MKLEYRGHRTCGPTLCRGGKLESAGVGLYESFDSVQLIKANSDSVTTLTGARDVARPELEYDVNTRVTDVTRTPI